MKSKRIEKNIYHANTSRKKAKLAIIILDRADFKARKLIRDKEDFI